MSSEPSVVTFEQLHWENRDGPINILPGLFFSPSHRQLLQLGPFQVFPLVIEGVPLPGAGLDGLEIILNPFGALLLRSLASPQLPP
jgi:hypothetical protein